MPPSSKAPPKEVKARSRRLQTRQSQQASGLESPRKVECAVMPEQKITNVTATPVSRRITRSCTAAVAAVEPPSSVSQVNNVLNKHPVQQSHSTRSRRQVKINAVSNTRSATFSITPSTTAPSKSISFCGTVLSASTEIGSMDNKASSDNEFPGIREPPTTRRYRRIRKGTFDSSPLPTLLPRIMSVHEENTICNDADLSGVTPSAVCNMSRLNDSSHNNNQAISINQQSLTGTDKNHNALNEPADNNETRSDDSTSRHTNLSDENENEESHFRLLGRTRPTTPRERRHINYNETRFSESQPPSAQKHRRSRRSNVSKGKPKGRIVNEWVDNTMDEDMALLKQVMRHHPFPKEDTVPTASVKNCNRDFVEDNAITVDQVRDCNVQSLPRADAVCNDLSPGTSGSSMKISCTDKSFHRLAECVTVQNDNCSIEPSSELPLNVLSAPQSDEQQCTELETCDRVRETYPYMPFTDAPTSEDLRASTKLKIPSAYSELLQLFTVLEQVIAQRRRHGDPLLFSVTPSHSGGVSLQEHTQRLGGRRFTLNHVRQMAWIAPHLITLGWAPVSGGIPIQSYSTGNGAPVRSGWDLEVQQRKFDPKGPIVMASLKQSEIHLRIKAFRFACVRWLLLRHDEFLATCEPPLLPIPLRRLSQWHPQFDLEVDAVAIPLVALPARVQAIQQQTTPLRGRQFNTFTAQATPNRLSRSPVTPVRWRSIEASPLQQATSPFVNMGVLADLTPLRLGTSPAPTTVDQRLINTVSKDLCMENDCFVTPKRRVSVKDRDEIDQRTRTPSPTRLHTATTTIPFSYTPPSRSLSALRFATPVRYTAAAVTDASNVNAASDLMATDVTPTRTPRMQRSSPDHVNAVHTTPGYKRSITKTVRTPFRSRTPPASINEASASSCRKQWFLQKAEEGRQLQDLETMLQKDLQTLQLRVRDAEDTVACLEGLAKVFLRSESVPLAQLNSLVSKVTSVLRPKCPDIDEARVLSGINRVAEKTAGVITLRESKCNRDQKLVQFHRLANIDVEKDKLVKELHEIEASTQILKEERLKKEFRSPPRTGVLGTPPLLLSPFPNA